MVATRRKPRWTIEEWTAFGKRCQGLRNRIMRLSRTFPVSPGGRERYRLMMLYKASLNFLVAMQATEKVIDRQYPELNEWNPDHYESRSSSDIIHGKGYNDPEVQTSTAGLIFSREQWAKVGMEVKGIAAACSRLIVDLGQTAYATPGVIGKYERVASLIEEFRCNLSDQVCMQHPDWQWATQVF